MFGEVSVTTETLTMLCRYGRCNVELEGVEETVFRHTDRRQVEHLVIPLNILERFKRRLLFVERSSVIRTSLE